MAKSRGHGEKGSRRGSSRFLKSVQAGAKKRKMDQRGERMGYGMGGMEAADGRRKKMIVKCKGRSG
jgi:hypothetical protein